MQTSLIQTLATGANSAWMSLQACAVQLVTPTSQPQLVQTSRLESQGRSVAAVSQRFASQSPVSSSNPVRNTASLLVAGGGVMSSEGLKEAVQIVAGVACSASCLVASAAVAVTTAVFLKRRSNRLAEEAKIAEAAVAKAKAARIAEIARQEREARFDAMDAAEEAAVEEAIAAAAQERRDALAAVKAARASKGFEGEFQPREVLWEKIMGGHVFDRVELEMHPFRADDIAVSYLIDGIRPSEVPVMEAIPYTTLKRLAGDLRRKDDPLEIKFDSSVPESAAYNLLENTIIIGEYPSVLTRAIGRYIFVRWLNGLAISKYQEFVGAYSLLQLRSDELRPEYHLSEHFAVNFECFMYGVPFMIEPHIPATPDQTGQILSLFRDAGLIRQEDIDKYLALAKRRSGKAVIVPLHGYDPDYLDDTSKHTGFIFRRLVRLEEAMKNPDYEWRVTAFLGEDYRQVIKWLDDPEKVIEFLNFMGIHSPALEDSIRKAEKEKKAAVAELRRLREEADRQS